MTQIRTTGKTWASYSQFEVIPSDAISETDELSNNLLARKIGGKGVLILTGLQTGFVNHVGVGLTAEPPLQLDEWEDIAQTDICPQADDLVILGWAGESIDETNLVVTPSEFYTIRVSARGRKEENQDILDEGSEEFLIEVWPTGSENMEITLIKGCVEAL